MACQDGVIKVWTGEEWEKMACQGCENCLMDEDMPTKSLIERYSTQMADGSIVVDDLTGVQKEFIDRYAAQAALYADGKSMQATEGARAEGSTRIHEQLERHITPDDTSETPTDAPGMPQMPQEVIDQGAQAMTEWVIKQTALAKKAMDKISKTMDTPRPVPNRADKRKRSREMQRYFNQQRNQ